MALQSSGPISNALQGEFGGSNPISLSEYYSAATGVPSSGNPISLSDFYGKANTVTFTIQYKAQEVQVVGVFLMVQALQQLQVDLLASQDQA